MDEKPEWEPHGKVTRIDAEHFCIVVPWGKKLVSKIYRHEMLDPDPEVGHPAIRLTKQSGRTYDVIRMLGEKGPFWSCECPRYERYGKCKHLRACVKMGLIKE